MSNAQRGDFSFPRCGSFVAKAPPRGGRNQRAQRTTSIGILLGLGVFLGGVGLGARIAPAQTQLPRMEADYKRVCAQATAEPLAPPKFEHPQPETWLQHCHAKVLYYGFDPPPDPAAALQCAWYERAHPQPQSGNPFYGPGVLTMLYANGKGVPRDYNLAIRFVCENRWLSINEIEAMTGDLEDRRDAHATASDFDICKDGFSGLMMGACEGVRQGFADARRGKELADITATWSPAMKDAFQALQAAEDAFEDARTGHEVDLSGTGRAAFALEEQGRLRDQFLINLRRFATGQARGASADERAALDRELDALYQRIEQAPAILWQFSGTIKPQGIRDSEQAWLKLRAAWIQFGQVAYPSLGADAVDAQITRPRLRQLRSLLSCLQ